jgi:hypothetical protein
MTLPFFPDRLYYLWFFGLPLLALLIMLWIIALRKSKIDLRMKRPPGKR